MHASCHRATLHCIVTYGKNWERKAIGLNPAASTTRHLLGDVPFFTLHDSWRSHIRSLEDDNGLATSSLSKVKDISGKEVQAFFS